MIEYKGKKYHVLLAATLVEDRGEHWEHALKLPGLVIVPVDGARPIQVAYWAKDMPEPTLSEALQAFTTAVEPHLEKLHIATHGQGE